VELTEQGILIRPPEKEHHTQDHVASSGDPQSGEPEKIEASSGLAKVWQGLKSRFTRSSRNGEEK